MAEQGNDTSKQRVIGQGEAETADYKKQERTL